MPEKIPSDKPIKTPPSKPSWLWKILFLAYLFSSVTSAVLFFNPASPLQIYYKILVAFHTFFMVAFLLNALTVIFDVLAIFPFYGFVDGKKLLSARTWKCFFVLRSIFFITGHSYASKELLSLLHHDSWAVLSFMNLMAVLYLPSYIATFLYAFSKSSPLVATRQASK